MLRLRRQRCPLRPPRGLTVSVMLETLGVREGTLFLTCVEAFGRPPRALLLELRLNVVRRALAHRSAERTVTAVASRFGFWHFRQLFRRVQTAIRRTALRHSRQSARHKSASRGEAPLSARRYFRDDCSNVRIIGEAAVRASSAKVVDGVTISR